MTNQEKINILKAKLRRHMSPEMMICILMELQELEE